MPLLGCFASMNDRMFADGFALACAAAGVATAGGVIVRSGSAGFGVGDSGEASKPAGVVAASDLAAIAEALVAAGAGTLVAVVAAALVLDVWVGVWDPFTGALVAVTEEVFFWAF